MATARSTRANRAGGLRRCLASTRGGGLMVEPMLVLQHSKHAVEDSPAQIGSWLP